MNIRHEIVRRNGKPAYARVPLAEWRRVLRRLDATEDRADVSAYDRAKRRREETFPLELVRRLGAGENGVRLLRKHRKLTQTALAEQVGVNAVYLSQIETGRRTGSPRLLRRLANALSVDIDLLVPGE